MEYVLLRALVKFYSYSCRHSQPTVDSLVAITTSGDNTAGRNYSLECVTVTGSTITWLDPMNDEIVPTTSILTFNPLTTSDAGTYTCRATLGSIVETTEVMVTVQSECLVSMETKKILCGHAT